jgi:hypothetical protein
MCNNIVLRVYVTGLVEKPAKYKREGEKGKEAHEYPSLYNMKGFVFFVLYNANALRT